VFRSIIVFEQKRRYGYEIPQQGIVGVICAFGNSVFTFLQRFDAANTYADTGFD